MPLNKKLLRKYKLEHHWPGGDREVYDPTLVYELASHRHHFHIGYGWREVHEARRRRIIVFKETSILWPPIEFEGVDDFNSSGLAIWPVKRPGGNKHYRLDEEPHQDLRSFDLRPFRDLVNGKGAYRGWGLVVHKDDHDEILRAALVRDAHRRQDV